MVNQIENTLPNKSPSFVRIIPIDTPLINLHSKKYRPIPEVPEDEIIQDTGELHFRKDGTASYIDGWTHWPLGDLTKILEK